MKIPLSKIYIDNNEINAAKQVLKSGWLAHGPKNEEFENLFKNYINTKYASCFNSCASALLAAIMAYELKGEIILPSFTYVASANAVVLAGCVPVFADINPKTFNIDPDDIKRKITKNTVAIMPVHYAGQISEMDRIMDIAKERKLIVIEDSAETIGAELNNKKAGSFGVGCFSFYPTKNITTGEGGMVTFNDYSILSRLNAIKSHGLVKPTFKKENEIKSWYRDAVLPGYNFRMSDINAAIGVEQIKKIEKINLLRRENALYFNDKLERYVGSHIVVPKVDNIKNHVYQMYVVKVNDDLKRDALLNYLKERGIGASVHFDPPVHLQAYYKQKYPVNLPATEKVCKQVITLPMFPGLKKKEINYMAQNITNFFKNEV